MKVWSTKWKWKAKLIIFPNPKVAIGQRAMLMVKPVSVAGKVS